MIRRPLPLRTRLALGYTGFVLAVLLLLGVGLTLAVRNAMLREIELQLSSTSALIAEDFDRSDASPLGYFNDPDVVTRVRQARIEGLDTPSLYLEALNLAGVVTITSPNLRGTQLPLPPAMLADLKAGREQSAEAALDGAPVLLFGRPLIDNGVVIGSLVIAQSLREVEQTLRLIVISLSVAGVVALLAAVRGGAWLAGRALQPVAEIAATARQIVRAEDLSRRVGASAAADELGQLTTTINEMLERLDQQFSAQRRFVADVSHELRTPLTAMRGNLEVLRRGAERDPQARDESLADISREVDRLVRLTSDLLLLAQAEAGLRLRREPVALDDLVLEVVRALHPLAGEVALTPVIAEQVEVIGDRDRLKQALLNLTVNAIQHTPAGGRVCLELERDGQHAYLRVSDTGEGIPPDQLPQVFDRFYRVDPARSRASGGAGLGLSIVRWVVGAHGGTVTASSTPGAGSTFTITLPLG